MITIIALIILTAIAIRIHFQDSKKKPLYPSEIKRITRKLKIIDYNGLIYYI